MWRCGPASLNCNSARMGLTDLHRTADNHEGKSSDEIPLMLLHSSTLSSLVMQTWRNVRMLSTFWRCMRCVASSMTWTVPFTMPPIQGRIHIISHNYCKKIWQTFYLKKQSMCQGGRLWKEEKEQKKHSKFGRRPLSTPTNTSILVR